MNVVWLEQADSSVSAPSVLARSVPAPTAATAATKADADAIRELWRLHGHALARFALKLTLGDEQLADDIVQETLLRAWRHPEVVGNGTLPVRSWLFTVTRRVAIDMWRAQSRRLQIIDDQQTEQPDPAEPIEQMVTALSVRAALAQLSTEHREVIVGMYLHGLSVAELARALDIPAGTVKSRTYYGLRQLRSIITETERACAL
jgi:RNA polymerase sigma-70 factor, ECF subfamily